MILYHQSPFEFDKFKFDLLGKDPDKSKNGRLGVWVWNKKPEKKHVRKISIHNRVSNNTT